MAQINIDQAKVTRIVRDTLSRVSDTGAHPAEIIIAMSECAGRVIGSIDGDIAQRELLDLAIKQLSGAILSARERIVTPH